MKSSDARVIDVVWPLPKPLDHFMIQDIFANKDFEPHRGVEFKIRDSFRGLTGGGVVCVLNGANTKTSDLNKKLAKFDWVLLLIISDENNFFDIDSVEHPNIKIWLQTPHASKEYENVRYYGVGYGYSKKYLEEYKDEALEKPLDIFISGQNTHERRELIFEKLHDYKAAHTEKNIEIYETGGFTQGMEPKEYYKKMAQAKIVPAPSGVISPDSFRLYEALEMGAIPIADDVSPNYDSAGYWDRVLPDSPIPILRDDNIEEILDSLSEDYQRKANEVFAWWIRKKREYYFDLHEDISELSGIPMPGRAQADINIGVEDLDGEDLLFKEFSKLHNDKEIHDKRLIISSLERVHPEYDKYQDFVKKILWHINAEYKDFIPIMEVL